MRRRTFVRALAIVTLAAAGATVGRAQPRRPKAEVTAHVASAEIRPGDTVRLTLDVRLPDNVHVQADKPRDPSLIPTALTLTPPAGVTVGKIVYPPAGDLVQDDRKGPLAVFGPRFTISVDVTLAEDVDPGPVTVPGRLRYQACDETTCYPPARAETQWTLTVAAKP